ncbi:hypothetical protein ACNJ69_12145 [Acinetobacter soli]|uniref:hypothetical protein n=1 Tax=Acinetobacter soli TaxID=487316 RepID=UPI003BA1FB29
MPKLVDYEAVYDGDKFTFIKSIKDDGTIDPRLGKNGPYSIMFIDIGDGIRISHQEDLDPNLIKKLVNDFHNK